LQILDIARSALGTRYVHGAESWATETPGRAGVDCSGLIAKAWQLPRAAESWEELGARPTTETLNVDTRDWFKLPLRARQPGDALVRYEADVRHAFIYERDEGEPALAAAGQHGPFCRWLCSHWPWPVQRAWKPRSLCSRSSVRHWRDRDATSDAWRAT